MLDLASLIPTAKNTSVPCAWGQSTKRRVVKLQAIVHNIVLLMITLSLYTFRPLTLSTKTLLESKNPCANFICSHTLVARYDISISNIHWRRKTKYTCATNSFSLPKLFFNECPSTGWQRIMQHQQMTRRAREQQARQSLSTSNVHLPFDIN